MALPSPGTWFRLASRRMQDDVDSVIRTLVFKGGDAVGGAPIGEVKDDPRALWSIEPTAGAQQFRLVNQAAGWARPLALIGDEARLVERADGGTAFYANGGRTYAGRRGSNIDNLWFFDTAERVITYFANMYVQKPWISYPTFLWEQGQQTKETSTYRQYDVAIWVAGQTTELRQSKVSVYKFPNDLRERANSSTNWAQDRDKFLVAEADIATAYGDPDATPAVRLDSQAALAAFKTVFDAILGDVRKTQSDFQFGMKYTGHGDADGLFERTLNQPEDDRFLEYVKQQLKRNIDLLDWSTNCSTSTYETHRGQAPYADIIVGSDLDRGRGFTSINVLPFLLSGGRTIREAVRKMLQTERDAWDTESTRQAMTDNRDAESAYAYDCGWFASLQAAASLETYYNRRGGAELNTIPNAIYANPERRSEGRVDVRTLIEQYLNNPALVSLFELYCFAGIDDRAFFDWTANGCDRARGFYYHL